MKAASLAVTACTLFAALVLVLPVAAVPAAAQSPPPDSTHPASGDRFHAPTRTRGDGRATRDTSRDTTRDAAVVPSDADWTPFLEHEGVRFSLIHYRRADNRNGGVVLRLINDNDYAVRYRVRLAFLSAEGAEERWRERGASGQLEAGGMKTGAPAGLFWVPFSGGAGVAEVRLAGVRITPVE